MATVKVSWPDLTFGPVNLLSLPPAWFFYMTAKEKMDLFHQVVMMNSTSDQSSEPLVH